MRWGITLMHNQKEIVWMGLHPVLFFTRAEARIYIREHFGWFKTRKDLKAPPHNWRMPKPVKVSITIMETENE